MTDRLSHALNWTRVSPPAEIEARAKRAVWIKHYFTNRRKTDPAFKVLCNLRGRIYAAVRHFGERTRRTGRTRELLGCTIAQLMVHLEAQFEYKMSWKNYGKWHIDHIRPCASFDLLKKADREACFHFTNLQPLWADENYRKGGRWAPERADLVKKLLT